MELKQRLEALRRQTGHSATPPCPPAGDLAARVRRLRPATVTSTEPSSRCGERGLATLVGGELLETGLILVESRVSLGQRHGQRSLACLTDSIGSLPGATGQDCSRLTFFDTETSGLAGGAGTQVFLLGLARLRRDELLVHQYLLTRFAGEPPLYRQARAWMQGCSALVSYNGRSFDAPLLAARARLAGVPDALCGLEHLDLLYPLRRAFGSRWPDCRLIRAEQELMGFQRHDDLPGSEAPRAWFDWLHRGNPELIPQVLQHNLWDLISLALLLPLLDRVYSDPPGWDGDLVSIARGYIRSGRLATALELLETNASQLPDSGLLLLAKLLKRRLRWDAATAIWQKLATNGNQQASEQLAKYHEHVSRQFALALWFADQLPPGPARDRRRLRLRRKLARPNVQPSGFSPGL